MKCLDVSLCFARCEIVCGVESTHENHWIILVDSLFYPRQSWFNHFEDVEPLFRHMVHDAWVHAPSRANFIKHASLHLKLCTEARDCVLKLAPSIGGCRSSPKDRTQRSPSFSHPAIVASLENHILLDSAYFFNASCWPIKQHSISNYQPQLKW